MKFLTWIKPSTVAPLILSAALAHGAATAQDIGAVDAYESNYFDTDNWGEDEYGLYDEDFSFTTDDDWYDDWNDTDLTAWNDADESEWGVLGYDDANDEGLFDW